MQSNTAEDTGKLTKGFPYGTWFGLQNHIYIAHYPLKDLTLAVIFKTSSLNFFQQQYLSFTLLVKLLLNKV